MYFSSHPVVCPRSVQGFPFFLFSGDILMNRNFSLLLFNAVFTLSPFSASALNKPSFIYYFRQNILFLSTIILFYDFRPERTERGFVVKCLRSCYFRGLRERERRLGNKTRKFMIKTYTTLCLSTHFCHS